MIRDFKITDITEDKVVLQDLDSGRTYVGDPSGFSEDLKVGDSTPCNVLEHAEGDHQEGTKVKAGVLARMLGNEPLKTSEADKKAGKGVLAQMLGHKEPLKANDDDKKAVIEAMRS